MVLGRSGCSVGVVGAVVVGRGLVVVVGGTETGCVGVVWLDLYVMTIGP